MEDANETSKPAGVDAQRRLGSVRDTDPSALAEAQARVEAKLREAGFVSIHAVSARSGLSLGFLYKLVRKHEVLFHTYKHSKYPQWTALRAVIPLADVLELPMDASEFAIPYDLHGGVVETTEGTSDEELSTEVVYRRPVEDSVAPGGNALPPLVRQRATVDAPDVIRQLEAEDSGDPVETSAAVDEYRKRTLKDVQRRLRPRGA